jgi:hypothetical protein
MGRALEAAGDGALAVEWRGPELRGALRLPAVLFGVASIGALVLLASSVATRREALLAAGFLSVSYHHVWFSQNARGYSGLLFWTLLASWLLVRALHSGRRTSWVAFAMAVALGTFTHMSMVFIATGLALATGAVLWRRREPDWVGTLLGFALAGTLAVWLHALVLPQLIDGILFQGSRAPVAEWKNPLWSALEILRSADVGFGLVPALAAAGLFAVGLVSFARDQPLVVGLLVFPTGVAGAAMLGMGYTLFPRFFFFNGGVGALILMRGALRSGELGAEWLWPGSGRGTTAGTALGLAICVASALSLPAAYAPKQDFEGALAFIREQRRPDDVVVTVGMATLAYEQHYRTGWAAAETLEELDALRSRSGRIWLVYTMPIHLSAESPQIMQRIERNFRLEREFFGTLGGGSVFVCLGEGVPD